MCQITILLYSSKEKILRIVIRHPFFGDLSQNEKLSEIKPPLERHFRNGWMQCYFISISIKFKCQMKEVWNRCYFTIPFFLCKKCDVKLKRVAELKFETRLLGILYCRIRTFVPLHFTKKIKVSMDWKFR